jgi:hypothetical protein
MGSEVITLAESMRNVISNLGAAERERAERGLVRFDPEKMCFFFANWHQDETSFVNDQTGVRGDYNLTCSELYSPAMVFRYIAHLREKAWFTNQVLVDFLDELNVALALIGYSLHMLPEGKFPWPRPKR